MAVSAPIRGVILTANESKKKISQGRDAIKSVGQVILKRTKVKREAFAQTNIFRKRREESEKRMMLEDELEAPRVVMTSTGPQQLVQATGTRGFFDRILGFIGYLAAGWIMNNLPTWIAMGKEFVARLQRAGEIVSGFFNNTIKLFTNVGNILGALGQNLMQFDFFDTSNRVKNAMGELNNTMGNLTGQIEEAFSLLTTPLTEGKYSGEQIPGVGTQQTDEGAYAEPPPYRGEETTSGGKVANPQAIYSYLRQLGVPHIHAVGIVANIKGESGFRIDADETGNGAGGIGLFQYTYPSRKQAFLRAVPDYKTNWKGQIAYAIKQDPNTPIYLRKQFSTPEQAADDFMINWERPSKSVYVGRRKKHNDFIKSFKPGSTQQPSKSGSQPVVVTSKSAQYTKGTWETGGGFNPAGAKDVYGRPIVLSRSAAEAFAAMMKDSGGKVKGSDVASSQRSPAKNERVGGATRSKHLKGLAHDIHGTSGSWIRKFGSKYGWKANDYSGTHGGHFEFRGASVSTKPETPAQIAAPPQQTNMVPFSLTPERRGQDVMVIMPQQQQNIITPASGNGDMGPSAISDFELLNNFIKNKLLLDLAYL